MEKDSTAIVGGRSMDGYVIIGEVEWAAWGASYLLLSTLVTLLFRRGGDDLWVHSQWQP